MTSTDAEKVIQKTESEILRFICQQRLVKPGDRVITACSGGADSMALLLFFLRCRKKLAIEVLAAHVNHGIRGAASRADADFVQDFCRRNGVELFLFDAEKEGVSIPRQPSEDWARRLRYGWFDELAAREEALIATAHTLNDQAETVLFRLARGTGVRGLSGIPPRRDGYIRPCLCLTRSETEAYCAAVGQSYVQDETNETDSYARNRLRHDAIPALEFANPAAVRSMGRLCSQMRELDEWFSSEAATLLQAAATERGYDVETLRRADGPVLTAALHSLITPVRDAEEKYVNLLRFLILRGDGALQLSSEVLYKISRGELVRVASEGGLPPPAPPQPLSPGVFRLPGGFLLEIWVEKCEDFLKNDSFSKKDLTSCADYAKIQKSACLRTRQPGDYFRPSGRHIRKTLKKYYNELGIPPQRRALLPLIADGCEVLWLWGSGFAEGLEPDAFTQEILFIRAEKIGED